MIATQAQKVGINIKSVPMAFGEITNRLDQHNFQVFILGWKIGGSDPGYLYSFFHSSQGGTGGQNYPGYHNADFDKMIDQYRSIFDKPKRIQLIKDAQGLLVEDLPYNVLYYRTNIDASRKDKFSGWVQGTSGIWNGWSLLLLDSPKTPMQATFEGVGNRNNIVSGASMDIALKVTDKSGTALGDTDVTIKIESGATAAKLAVRPPYQGTSTGDTITGKTDASGKYVALFNSTAALNTSTTVSLSGLASKSGYSQEQTATYDVNVLKAGTLAISVSQFEIDPDTMMAGESAQVTIGIVDQAGQAVPSATVTFNVSLGTINPSPTTTDSGGKVTVTYSVPKTASISQDMKVDIVVNAEATLNGYLVPLITPVTKSVTVSPFKEPPKPVIPFLDSAVVVLTLLAASAVFAVYAARKRYKA
jgi:hypothetical protein